MEKKWDKDIIVAVIKRRLSKGEKLNSLYVQVHCKPLFMAAHTYFGGWRQAIEAAGLSYDDVRVKVPARKVVWTREIVAQTILSMRKEGRPLNSNYVQTKEPRLYGAVLNHFGSWQQAVEAAGLNYSSVRKKNPMRSWSPESIAAEIIRRSEAGLSIRGGDVANEDQGLYIAARRHFGKRAWAKARTLAGFDPTEPRPDQKWNEGTVREEIRRLHEEGVDLGPGALSRSEYKYLYNIGLEIFGSWSKAVRAAGIDYSKIRKNRHHGWWTKPRVLMCIRNLERRGIRLSSKATRLSHAALFQAALTHFGDWGQAVEAAGISYRRHTLKFSTKAWLRRMQVDEYEATLQQAGRHAQTRRRK